MYDAEWRSLDVGLKKCIFTINGSRDPEIIKLHRWSFLTFRHKWDTAAGDFSEMWADFTCCLVCVSLQEWPPSWPWPHSVSAPGTLSLKWPTPQLWTGSLPSATPSSSRLSLSLPPSTTSPRGATPGTEKVWFQRRYSFYSAVIHSVPHRNNEDNKEKNVLCLVTIRHRTAFITPVSTVAVSGFLNEVNPSVKGRKDPVYCTNT